MREVIDSFVDAMRGAGCAPANASDIVADDEYHYIDGEGDEARSKKIKYILKIDDGRGIGGFVHYRYGEWHTWVSNTDNKKYTAKERKDWQALVTARKKKQKEALESEYTSVAMSARTVWDGARLASEDHPYLKRKKIKGIGARVKDGTLLIPMYEGRSFWGYQSIDKDGGKLYLKGAKKTGCFFPMAHKDDTKDRIIICEGFATGASIREATNLITIVAFDAGNLEPVATAYRAKYPNSEIIIAADNDQWTFAPGKKPKDFVSSDHKGDDKVWDAHRKGGLLYNVGREKAQSAAAKIGNAFTIWPEIPADDPDKNTDYNGLHRSSGLAAVKERISTAGKQEEPKEMVAEKPRQGTWVDRAIMRMDSSGNARLDPVKSFNYFLAVSEHAQLYKIFAWDEFLLSVMVIKCPPWSESKDFLVHRLEDDDIINCDYFLQSAIDLNGNVKNTRSAIYAAARGNSVHPVRDHFDSLEWDGTPRLDNWLIDYVNCTEDDPEYVRAVGRTWMIAAVKRIYEPGCKFDHMLILEGDQGVGKSSALKIMATFGEEGYERSYFNDTFQIKNLESKDELAKLRGVMIIELQEMSGFNKKDRDSLTAFITTVEDEYRRPYGYENEKFPRQFVLSGTYNPVHGLFTDPTGYRRYWAVAVAGKIKFQSLKEARAQIWAETVHRYKMGETTFLSEALADKAHEAGKSRRVIDEWTYDVLSAFGVYKFMTVREIMTAMGIDIKGRGQMESRRINNILKSEGFKRAQRRKGGQSIWGWERVDGAEKQTDLYESPAEEIPF